jgi:molybdenum cofactor cytidylyltransferase
MGRHKLLLPWGDSTLIEAVLARWQASSVDRVVVVVRPSDEELIRVCRQTEAEVVVPASDPKEMKTSVQIALRHIEERYAPRDSDAWLLAPADMPELPSQVVDKLLLAHANCPVDVLAPTFDGRRGHPVLFSWSVSQDVHQLRADEGVNAILRRHTIHELPCEFAAIHQDLDTPSDYDAARSREN